MKKIINFKKAPQKLLILAMVVGTIFITIGCGKKNNNANTVATDAPVASTPALPENTDATVATPEPTIDPEIAKKAEEERMEKLATEAQAILSANKTEGYAYPISYDDELKQTYAAQGKFIGLPEAVAGFEAKSDAYELAKSNYLDEILLYLCEYQSNIAIASVNITWNGENSKLIGSQNWKKFQVKDGTYLLGADTLMILERLAQDVYDAYSADWDTFKAKAEIFQSFVAALFPENRNVFGDVQFTSRSRSNGMVQPYLISAANACLFAIANRTQSEGKVIAVPENPCFTTKALMDNLSEENYLVPDGEGNSKCSPGTEVNEYSYRYTTEVFALMDAYIYAQSQGYEIVVDKTLKLEP